MTNYITTELTKVLTALNTEIDNSLMLAYTDYATVKRDYDYAINIFDSAANKYNVSNGARLESVLHTCHDVIAKNVKIEVAKYIDLLKLATLELVDLPLQLEMCFNEYLNDLISIEFFKKEIIEFIEESKTLKIDTTCYSVNDLMLED